MVATPCGRQERRRIRTEVPAQGAGYDRGGASRLESERGVRVADLDDTSRLALGQTMPPNDERYEPVLMAMLGSREVIQLDPTRAELDPISEPPKYNSSRGLLGSLLLHLLLLLSFISWPQTPAGFSRPIPIQLVIENAPPPRTAEPKPLANSLQGFRVPEDFGATEEPKVDEDTSEAPGVQQPPTAAETRTVALASPPPIPQTAPPSARVTERPAPPAAEPQVTVAAPLPRTTADRDDYLAYLVTLTRQHLDLLPLSVIGDRRGETVVSVIMLNDGSIEQISVRGSSGYPDIDQRIEEMVAAIGKFPPVPKWFQGTSMQLELSVHFPEAWRQ